MVSPNSGLVNRRRVLSWLVAAVGGAVAATLGILLGGAVASPGLARRRARWFDAGLAREVTARRPAEVVVRVEREDGYRRVSEQRVVYLVRDGDRVRALSAVCTHLGCRVAWHDAERHFKCPCHGGRFTGAGQVAGGPPPRPLDELPMRLEGGRVMVKLT